MIDELIGMNKESQESLSELQGEPLIERIMIELPAQVMIPDRHGDPHS